MHDFSQPLGDVVRRARTELGLTQNQVADMVDIDTRTIIHIENYKGNPKMEVLFPLVRALRIDAREIFNPELERSNPSIRQLRFLIEECSEQEAAALLPAVESILTVLRSKETIEIEAPHFGAECKQNFKIPPNYLDGASMLLVKIDSSAFTPPKQ